MKNDIKQSMTNESKLTATKKMNPLFSVGTKLFGFIIGGILACVLTMGIMAYNESKEIIRTKVSQSSAQTINQLGVNLDNIFQTYEDITLQLMIDSEFYNLINGIIDPLGQEYDRFQSTRDMTNKLQSIIFGNGNINGIALIPIKDDLSPITAGNSQTSKIDSLKQEAWVEEVIKNDGRTYWINTNPEGISTNTSSPSFGVARVMKNTQTGNSHYILLLDISIDGVLKELSRVSLGDGSQINIINSAQEFLVHSDKEQIMQLAPYTVTDAVHSVDEATIDGMGEILLIQQKLTVTGWYVIGNIPVAELVKDTVIIRNLTITISIVAAIIAIIIALTVIWTVGRPLNKLRELMQEGAKGNLTIRSSLKKRRDEIGQLSESFDTMMLQINQLAKQTTKSAEEVLTSASSLSKASEQTAISAKEIAVATEEIANGSTSLAMEAERGNDITLMINDQMQQVLDVNKEMVDSAYDVERSSQQGTAYMAELIEKTGMTEIMTREMVDKVESLKESTRSIVKILDVLNNITKQTNILSLNATIEASRAGNAGRGFMVVANEIRELADQSTKSIEVVAQITDRIQNEIVETVSVLSKAHPLFQEQIHSVKEASHIFEGVQVQMNGLIHKLEEVTHSVHKLESSQHVLNEAMSNVSAVAEEASATSQEVASLSAEQLNVSDNLVDLSNELGLVSSSLKESLAKFKVE